MPYADPEKQREWQREYKRKWRAANREDLEKCEKWRRKWRAANREKVREQQRRYREKQKQQFIQLNMEEMDSWNI